MPAATETPSPPTLAALAMVFLSIGLQSFGGGTTSWIRREIVRRRAWMTEQQLLGGMALSQIAPGPNGINLAVFVGTTLRGPMGAAAALGGMLLVPLFAVLALGGAFVSVQDLPGVDSAMTGVGAAAIGMNAANGLQLTGHNLRTPVALGVMLITAGAVGLGRLPLLPVLLVMVPVSLVLAGRRR